MDCAGSVNASCCIFLCLISRTSFLGVQLLALLVPTLISYLLDENAISSAPQVSKGLHDFALQNLMRIGPQYPSAFKVVIGAAPELKTCLESAIRANQASSRAKAAARQAQPTVQAAPTIKLKTSFFWNQQQQQKDSGHCSRTSLWNYSCSSIYFFSASHLFGFDVQELLLCLECNCNLRCNVNIIMLFEC